MLENLTEQEIQEAARKFLSMVAVKAVGDWEIEIKAVPYGTDEEQQTFDFNTDYMEDTFSSPAILYHHGIKPGTKAQGVRGLVTGESLESKPMVIGKSIGVEKRADGVYIRAILDKTVEYARRVWDAAKRGLAVASSDSIMHLARLDIGGGKSIMYEKDRPGRISVWPLAGVSLWDSGNGNFNPASRNAYALPAMKAIYREAGLDFPEIENTTGGVQADEGKQRRTEIIEKSKEILRTAEKQRKRS